MSIQNMLSVTLHFNVEYMYLWNGCVAMHVLYSIYDLWLCQQFFMNFAAIATMAKFTASLIFTVIYT